MRFIGGEGMASWVKWEESGNAALWDLLPPSQQRARGKILFLIQSEKERCRASPESRTMHEGFHTRKLNPLAPRNPYQFQNQIFFFSSQDNGQYGCNELSIAASRSINTQPLERPVTRGVRSKKRHNIYLHYCPSLTHKRFCLILKWLKSSRF